MGFVYILINEAMPDYKRLSGNCSSLYSQAVIQRWGDLKPAS